MIVFDIAMVLITLTVIDIRRHLKSPKPAAAPTEFKVLVLNGTAEDADAARKHFAL